jgi:hypothetical protein
VAWQSEEQGCDGERTRSVETWAKAGVGRCVARMAPRAFLHEGRFHPKWNVRIRKVLRTTMSFFFILQSSLKSLPLHLLSLGICKSGSCF